MYMYMYIDSDMSVMGVLLLMRTGSNERALREVPFVFVIGVIDRNPVAEHALAKRALHAVFSAQVVEAGHG